MTRAAAIVIRDGMVALIRRVRDGQLYFIFPGGRMEPGETPEEATVREVMEELGLVIELGPLAAIVTFRGQQQFYFRTYRISGGVFGTGLGPEMLGQYPPENGLYEPVWLPIDQLLTEPVLPRPVAQLVVQAQVSGWPEKVQEYPEG